MRLLTREADYAVRALCLISGKKKGMVSVKDLVDELGIPRPFLRKILQILNKEGILNSYRGKGGGFSLALEPHKIFLSDIAEIFQGKLRFIECRRGKRRCPEVRMCILKEEIDSLEKYVISKLRAITIAFLSEKADRLKRRPRLKRGL